MKAKFVTFLFGLLVIIVAAIGLALSLDFTPSFLSVLPTNPVIYFGICIVLGIAAIIMGQSTNY